MRTTTLAALALIAPLASSCGLQHTITQDCSVAPCRYGPHHWTAHEVARDVASLTFPGAMDPRDHLYRITCQLNVANTRAACAGRGKIGHHAGQQVQVRMLLRVNGTLDELCWPSPSALCDPVQIKDQRAHHVTD